MRHSPRRTCAPALLALAAACAVLSVLPADSDTGLRPQDFQTKARFELTVTSSAVLKPGTSRIVAQSAFATLVHGLVAGSPDGLEVQFFTKPITDAVRNDILKRGAWESRKGDHAILVLFLDKDRAIAQVNLTVGVPGTTVTRTVAWKPEDLARFSSYRFDGKRLTLKNSGVYREMGDERLSLSWDVDVSLPVFERPRT